MCERDTMTNAMAERVQWLFQSFSHRQFQFRWNCFPFSQQNSWPFIKHVPHQNIFLWFYCPVASVSYELLSIAVDEMDNKCRTWIRCVLPIYSPTVAHWTARHLSKILHWNILHTPSLRWHILLWSLECISCSVMYVIWFEYLSAFLFIISSESGTIIEISSW